DRTGIAREKAGIFRPQRAAVIGEPDMPAEVIDAAKRAGVKLYQVSEQFHYSVQPTQWRWWSDTEQLLELPLPQLPLPNAATAIAALQVLALSVPQQAVRDGLEQAREVGRLQQLAG